MYLSNIYCFFYLFTGIQLFHKENTKRNSGFREWNSEKSGRIRKCSKNKCHGKRGRTSGQWNKWTCLLYTSVIHTGLIKDEKEQFLRTVKAAMSDSDLVLLSGGSSKGNKDFTAEVIEQLARPGVFTHGLALKPGKPTILGYDEPSRTILAGLPGHPAAAMLVFVLLFGRIFKQLRGEKPPVCIRAKMECNVPGAPGRETCQLVRLLPAEGGYLALSLIHI